MTNPPFHIINPRPEQQLRQEIDQLQAQLNAIGHGLRGTLPELLPGNPLWTSYYEGVLRLRQDRDELRQLAATIRDIGQRIAADPATRAQAALLRDLLDNIHELAANAVQDTERSDADRFMLLSRIETFPRWRYRWRGVLALLDTPTEDGRILPTPDQSVGRRLPVFIRLLRGELPSIDPSGLVGVIAAVNVADGELRGEGWVELAGHEYQHLLGPIETRTGKISLRCEVDSYDPDRNDWILSGAVLAADPTGAAWGDRTYIDLDDDPLYEIDQTEGCH